MDKKLIEQWAQESMCGSYPKSNGVFVPAPNLQTFARLAMAHQRELDAELCLSAPIKTAKQDVREACANAINNGEWSSEVESLRKQLEAMTKERDELHDDVFGKKFTIAITAAEARIKELVEALEDSYLICLSRGRALGLDDCGPVLDKSRLNLNRTDPLSALKDYRRKVLEEAAVTLDFDNEDWGYKAAGILRRMAQEDL